MPSISARAASGADVAIEIAQGAHIYSSSSQTGFYSNSLTLFQSRLLITNVLDSEYIFLYEAQVSRKLLDGLRDLKIAVHPITWPTIRRKRIPFQPYSTFLSRLMAELVAYCEPYSPRKKRLCEQEKQGALKRRRMNSSSVERIGDCQSMK